jgi:putative transposase
VPCLAISEQTLYTWRWKYGGMEQNQVVELMHVRAENGQLKRLVAEQALDMQALKAITEK